MTRAEFVQKCGELLNVAKPHLVSCELRLGKDLPEDPFEWYAPNSEYVLVTCENDYHYVLPVGGNSLAAIAEEIFRKMVCK